MVALRQERSAAVALVELLLEARVLPLALSPPRFELHGATLKHAAAAQAVLLYRYCMTFLI